MKRHVAGCAVTAVASFAIAASSCGGGRAKGAGAVPPPNAAPTRVYVAIGGSDARGIGTDNPVRESWPQDLFRTLPANYRLANLGVPDTTLSAALADQLPVAESLHPSLVTVWVNVDDVLSGVLPAAYQADLSTLIHALRATGATVLVANTPPLDRLPAYLACVDPVADPGNCPSFLPTPLPAPEQVPAIVDRYNAAIATVAAREGAVLVDLHRAATTTGASGATAFPLSDDGFHPSAAGAAAIARQFAAVVPK